MLTVKNDRYLIYHENVIIIEVLGAVDVNVLDSMYCTLKVSTSLDLSDNPIYRQTLNLYNREHLHTLNTAIADTFKLFNET